MIFGGGGGETGIEYKMRAWILSASLSGIFLILRRFERDMTKMCIDHQVKYPLILSDLN
jgi:hypothetical protein